MKGYVHSIQSMGTLDGPGLRSVVFTEGCPLRCIYCQNPETWKFHEENLTDSSQVAKQILRFYPYIKNGGVTFSGGEPCMQAEFVCEIARILKSNGLHVALDTCGEIDSSSVDELLEYVDLVLLDIKMTNEDDSKKYIGTELYKSLDFLKKVSVLGKDVWIRHVIVPGINDNDEDILRLSELIKGYDCIKKIELLPFRKLCIEKYKSLGIPFLLENTPEMNPDKIKGFYSLLPKFQI